MSDTQIRQPVRSRVSKRPNVKINVRPGLLPRWVNPISESELRHLCATIVIRPLRTAFVRRGMQEIAGTYRRQTAQGTPSRAEAGHGLRAIATWGSDPANRALDADGNTIPLRVLVGTLNGLATSALWGGLDRLPAYDGHGFNKYLSSPDADPDVIVMAAELALSLLRSGDYSNQAAAIALNDLIALYEQGTGMRATFSVRRQGPLGAGGSQRAIGTSPVCRFAMAFFEVVDPALSPLWQTGKIRVLLRERRAAAQTVPIFPT